MFEKISFINNVLEYILHFNISLEICSVGDLILFPSLVFTAFSVILAEPISKPSARKKKKVFDLCLWTDVEGFAWQ